MNYNINQKSIVHTFAINILLLTFFFCLLKIAQRVVGGETFGTHSQGSILLKEKKELAANSGTQITVIGNDG